MNRKKIFFLGIIFLLQLNAFSQVTFLGDNNVVTADAEISQFTQAGDTAYFVTSREFSGLSYATVDLWLTDGTEAGTKEVCPNFIDSIRSTDYTFTINGMIVYQGELYFFIQNHGLYKTDGTEAGTMLVKHITSDGALSGSWYPDLDVDFTIVNNTLFFKADQYPFGMELWKTNGTGAGTQLVKDIHLEFNLSSGSFPHHLTPLGSNLIFSAIDVEHGREMWISDGTEAGTQMLSDLSPGISGSVFDDEQMDDIYVFNGEAYFLATISGTGGINPTHFLCKTDGTTVGTVTVFELPAASGGLLIDGKFIEYNNDLYFVFGNKTYKTNGTTAGTSEVWTYRAEDFAVYDNKLFMFVKELTSSNGFTVYFDGGVYYTTGSGVTQVATTDIIKPNPFMGILNGKLLYHNGELYNYDNSGENMVKDIWLGDKEGVLARTWSGNQNEYIDGPGQFVNMGSYVLFYGNDATGGNLWKSDGTAGGTVMVKRLHNEGTENTFEYPPYAAAIGSDIIFPAENQTGEVWKTDGTLASTQKIANTEAVHESRIGSKLAGNGTQVFMTTGEKVYVTDGTAGGTIGLTATDGVMPGLDEEFGVIHPVNGKLIFNGPIDANGQSRLYVSDGTNAGTSELGQVYGNGTFNPKYDPNTITVSSNHVYFMAAYNSGSTYEGVYKTDGTNATTEGILTGLTWPKLLGNAGDTLYLTHADDDGLYKLEPGSTTATLLKADLSITKFIMGDTYGLFLVNNPSSERGTWITDGTAAGTVKIQSTYNSNISDYLIENDSSLFYTNTISHTLYEVDKQAGSNTKVLDNVNQILEFNNKIAIINQYSNIFLMDNNVEDLIGIYSSDTLSNFHSAYAQGNKLFFRASGTSIGDELFCYELPPDPTIQVMRESFNYSNNNSVWIGSYVNNDTIDGYGFVAEAWVDTTVVIGDDSENQSDVYFALVNSGPSALTISQTELTGDFAHRFQLIGMPTQVAPYSIERFKASFTGDSIHGDIFAMLKIHSNDPNDPVFSLRLKGSSLSIPYLTTSDTLGRMVGITEHKLPLTDIGQTSYSDLYTMNSGYGNLGIIDSIVVSGTHASDFVVTPNKTEIKGYLNKLIDPADQQDSLLNNDNFHAKLTIAYTPSDNGDRYATLKIYSNGLNQYNVQTIELTGYAGCMANDIITPEGTQVLCTGSDDSITFTYPHVDNAAYCWGYLGDWKSVGSPDFMQLSGSSTLDYDLYFDTANVPIALIYDNRKISVVRFNGSDWDYLGNQYIATSAYEPSLAIDTDNNFYLSYRTYISGNQIYTVLKYDGMSWNQLSADNAGGNLATLGTDLYAANSYLNQFLRATVVKWTGSSWDTIGVPGFTAASAYDLQLESNNNTLYLAFKDGSHLNSGASVMKFDGSSWVYVGQKGVSQYEVQQFYLDFDNTGKMYLNYQAYDSLDNQKKINEVKVYENGTWNSLDFDTYRRPLNEQLTVSMDLWDNTPYVAYNELDNTSRTVQIVKHPGATWQGYLSDTPMDDVTSLSQETRFRFDNNGIPYFIYSGRTQGDYNYFLNVIAHDPNAACLSTTNVFTTSTPGRYNVKITDTLNMCSYYSLNTVTVIEEECFPEIELTGNGVVIDNNFSTPYSLNNTLLGHTLPGDSIEKRFIINNLGTGNLILTDSVQVKDQDETLFKVSVQPQDTIYPGDTSSFVVKFLPVDFGTFQTNIYIENNDESESTLKFAVKGGVSGFTVSKTDSLIYDENSNEKMNPIDTLLYTIVVKNDANAPTNNSITLEDEVSSYCNVVVGSVTSQIGSISSGNNVGEISTVTVNYATFNPANIDTVTFKVVLTNAVPEAATILTNQAWLYGGTIPNWIDSDDPDFPGDADTTKTPITPPCDNPTNPGSINNAQSICSGDTPSEITSSSAASGHVGTLEYKWQESTTSSSAGFSDIANSNSETYSPGALTTTTWFKRIVRVDCEADWSGAVESNVIEITVPTVAPPVLTVQSNTATTATESTANGTITKACVNATNRGAIWYEYTDTDKEIGDINVTNVNESGDFGETAFSASLTGLSPNTRYNVRAHATNPDGTGYSARTDFRTLANVPAAPSVDGATASSLDVTVNANSNPASTEFVIAETSTGKFVQADGSLNTTEVWQDATTWGTQTVSGLTTGVTYTFKVKARNGDNVETAYGTETQGVPVTKPVVSTQAVTLITTTSSTGNGSIDNTNGANATNRGLIIYPYTGTNKEIGGIDVTNLDEAGDFGSGAFTASFTGLDVNTQYDVRAHATNLYGTGYGDRVSFWTLANVPAAPTVDGATATTLDVTVNANGNPASTEFVIAETSTGKYVQADGSLNTTEVWQDAATWGAQTVTGLTTGVPYTFKVKARNGANVETANGTETQGVPVAKPVVSTQAVTLITTTSSTGNGSIDNTNGANATNRGLIIYPYTGTNKEIGGIDVTNIDEAGDFGSGAFTASFTGLDVNTQYDVRAHATNQYGTGYGDRVSFWTLANVPDAPTVDGNTAISLNVSVNENGNPSSTEFLILETTGNKYVQANGTLGNTAVWQSSANWGVITVNGLNTGVTYTFKVKARNGDHVETDYGAEASGTTCKNPTDGGTIADAQTICYGTVPNALTSTTEASGYGGTLEYKWQYSITDASTGFIDIASSDASSYSPGALNTSTWYKRLARVDCKADWTDAAESNVIQLTVYNDFTPGTIESTGETICYNGDPTLIGSSTDANGGDESITYQWESSTDNFATSGTLISGATSASYDPPAGLTTTTSYRRYAHDGTCNTTFEVSAGTWAVTVYNDFTPGAIETTGETICYGDDPVLIGSSTVASGGDESISYQWQSSNDNFVSTPTDLVGSNSVSYDPPANLTETTWYRRQAVDATCNTAWETSTGVWKVSVDPLPTPGIISNAPICAGENLTLRGMYEPVLCESNCSVPQNYCASGSNLPFYQYISEVKLADSINSSSYSGYSDNTSGLFQILYLDSTYALSVEINNYFNYLHTTNCYIDWNRDGDFDDPGEKTELGSGMGSQQLNGMISVPSNAVLGQTMMRVVNRQTFDAPACGSYPIGETEDYLLEIRGMDTQSIISYEWSGPAGSSTAQNWTIVGASPEEGGTYNLTVTNTYNCSDVASVQAQVLNPQPNLGADTLYSMFPDTLQFDPGLFDSYQWNTGATTQQISGENYGSYKVTVSQLQCTAEDSVWVGEIQNIGLREGWGIFSTYINTALEMHELFADFATKPIIVKNDAGQVYWDFIGVDEIGALPMHKGYMIKMANADELIVYGDAYAETSPVSLDQGYNIVSYLRKYAAPVDEIFSDVVNHLILVKDQDGMAYWPVFQVNLIGDMENGQGYIVKMIQADTLIYPSNSTLFAKNSIMIESPKHYSRARNTGENMTLGIPLEAWDALPENGDEVAVFTKDGDLIGSAVFQGSQMALPVWSKDLLDQQSKGLSEAEAFDIYIYHQASGEQEKLEVIEWLKGDGTYTRNGVAVVGKLIRDGQANDLSGLEAEAYPNPFRNEFEIVITLPESSNISVSLYDVLGRKMEELFSGSYNKGRHQIRYDAARLTAGSYYLRVESNTESKLIKLTKFD